jgi:hypothetical protein
MPGRGAQLVKVRGSPLPSCIDEPFEAGIHVKITTGIVHALHAQAADSSSTLGALLGQIDHQAGGVGARQRTEPFIGSAGEVGK